VAGAVCFLGEAFAGVIGPGGGAARAGAGRCLPGRNAAGEGVAGAVAVEVDACLQVGERVLLDRGVGAVGVDELLQLLVVVIAAGRFLFLCPAAGAVRLRQ
jgi:hypothetical protein